jgi:hypothetical protein
MSRASVKIPFDCTVKVLKTMVEEVLGFYETRIASEWMSSALRNGLDFESFRAFNTAVFKVSQDIKFATKSKTHEVLWNTPKPFVSAKRLLGWIITGQDFHAIPQGQRWASYTDVLGANTFHEEVAKAFLAVSEGNNFELVFVDAARFTEDAAPEGDLVPVLTWLKPELAPKTGPYKTAAQQNITTITTITVVEPAPAKTTESKPVENLAAAAGAGGASWADIAEKLPMETPVESKEEPTELQMTSAIMLLQTLTGPKHALTYKTIDTLAVELVKMARKLTEA